jgi:DNA-binding winged helix-turn-helix (wHTH) protein
VTTMQSRGDVKLLRWPAEAARRELYRAQGVLRLLVVEGGVAAPVCSDFREDWVRPPISDSDLMVRVATLRAKAEAHRLPQVDPCGLLSFGGQTSTVSRTETDLLECLIRQFGQPVPRETLQECLPDRPGGTSRNALDLHIMRVRRRIAPLGLVIRTVWGRGYMLEEANSANAGQGGGGRKRQQHDADVDPSTGRPMAAAEVAALRWARANPDVIRPAAS